MTGKTGPLVGLTEDDVRRIVREELVALANQVQPQSLNGLEVAESDFGAWLEAGGDRRDGGQRFLRRDCGQR